MSKSSLLSPERIWAAVKSYGDRAITNRHNPRRSAALDGRLSFGPNVDIRYAEIQAEGKNIIAEGTKVSGKVKIGYGSTIGRQCNLFGTIVIGRYCQLAPCVGIFSSNHPYNHITTYIGSNLFSGRLKQGCEDGEVHIGNDVWLGHQAVILSNVTIGDGAVIAAGSVVTKDVDDYTIVAGIPARPIKKRFPLEIVSVLKSIKWWEMSEKELLEKEYLFHLDLTEDVERSLEQLRACLARHEVPEEIG